VQPSDSPGARLRALIRRDIVVLPGVFNAIYLSGAGVTNATLAAPDIGLLTLTEMAQQARYVVQAATAPGEGGTAAPVVADADTGYGEAWNVARAVWEFEGAGLAGIHLEDQLSPKRCGHLDGKQIVSIEQMAAKVRAAVDSKRDSSFMLIARTDARSVEGMEAAIERARVYVGAGADGVFPEGLESELEFETFRKAIDVPLLANMTEFGRTPLISVSRFRELGYNLVIFPMSAFRLMLKAIGEGYAELLRSGTQAAMLDRMQTRAGLYALLDYPVYEERDRAWAEMARTLAGSAE
jgi:methylisocitrate lyase